MVWKRRKREPEFKPDANPSTFAKTARLTQQQKLQLSKWLLYTALCAALLVLQDVLMSQLRLFGATTDLAVCGILLVAMLEGVETGSLFLLIASAVYYFTGSAPGPYCIALLTVLGVAAMLVRQMFLHRSKGTIVVVTGITVILYEIGLFVIGLVSGLTLFARLPVFLFAGLYSALALILLYNPFEKISLIGGSPWKE